jgi:membrane fusion protein (multidrug efflux system)
MKKNKLQVLFALVVLSAAIALGCKEEKAAVIITPDVNVVAAGQQTVPVYTEFVGQTYGISDVNIRSKVDGYIMSMHFKEGQVVQKGQLLYVIDDRNIQAKIDAAEARLAEAKTYLVKAKADLDRVEPLAQMNALSKRDLDAAVATYNASQNQVDAASAALRNTKIDLAYTRITAPLTGIIGISKLLVGDFVSQGNLGEAINTISAVGAMRVRFPVTESEFLRFRKRATSDSSDKVDWAKLPIELLLSDNSAYYETGRMDLANRQIDPETGSLLLQAVFENKEGLLRPGQYVKVRFKTDEFKDAIMVPQAAVNQIQSVFQVFVVGDSAKLAPRIVTTGARVGRNWIITSGLKPGEKVAVIGSASINPKNAVNPVTMNWNYDSTSRN